LQHVQVMFQIQDLMAPPIASLVKCDALIVIPDADLRRPHHCRYLLVHVPYVNSKKEVKFGILVADLQTTGTRTARPADHVVRFAGEAPCDAAGTVLSKVIIDSTAQAINPELTVHHRFSSKPVDEIPYPDYYEKMTA